MSGHRWSGWPGAWCLDCGCDDPAEVALGTEPFEVVDDGAGDERIRFTPEVERRIAEAMVCPEPGSKRHDPYAARANPEPRDV